MELRHRIIRSNGATRIQASTHPHQARSGICTLCTGYFATLSVRDVLWHSQRQHHWLLDFDWLVLWHIPLPAWIVAGVNLAFYAGLLWGGALLYRIAQGKKPVLVVTWAALIFLDLLPFLLSPSPPPPIIPPNT